MYRNLARSLKLSVRAVPTSNATQLARFFAERPGCPIKAAGPPPCTTETIKKDPCVKMSKKLKKPEKTPFKSMWEMPPDCCKPPCPDLVPRFDELYYKISDKAKRKYRRTWSECPKIQILPKKLCCFENVIMPKMEKRVRGERPVTACPPPVEKDEKGCDKKQNLKCFKIVLPGCRGVRNPPKCVIIRKRTKCAKVKVPTPAFSECARPRPKPRHPLECQCVRVIMMCEVWNELRRRKTAGLI